MQQRHQYPAARCTDRVAQGDGTAIDVDLVHVPLQLPGHGQRLGGKGFVGFNQVQLLQGPAGLVQAAAGGRDRADAHDGRVDPGVGVGTDFRQHWQAQGLGFFSAHQQHRRRTVIERRSVASGDAAVLLEGGLEFTQGFGGGAGPWLFVGGKGQRIALALGNQDRRDLIGEATTFNRGHGFLLGRGGKGILFLATDAVLVHQVFGCDAHVVIVEGVPQTIGDHAVDHLCMAHAQARACGRQHVGGQAHVFHAAGNDDVGIAAADRLGTEVQRLEARATDLVQGHRGYCMGQPGQNRRLARRVLPGACGQYLA